MGKVLFLDEKRDHPSMADMIFDKMKREAAFRYYDHRYEETEDEIKIFKSIIHNLKKGED